MTYRFRDLLALEPLTADELRFLLDQSKPFQEIQKHPLKKLATLRGKTVALAFFENSTRTRISFGTAASRLGADTMNLQAEASSIKKGETLLDTAFNLNAMKPDCFVMRHSASGAADYVARHLDVPVLCRFIKPHFFERPQGSVLATEISFSPSVDVKGQHVLLVEGLVQSGVTSDYLMHSLVSQGALSVKLAALLDKSSARRVALRPDYFGFMLDESFVTGYGLGSPHLGRNLPYIQAMNSKALSGSPEETVR